MRTDNWGHMHFGPWAIRQCHQGPSDSASSDEDKRKRCSGSGSIPAAPINVWGPWRIRRVYVIRSNRLLYRVAKGTAGDRNLRLTDMDFC